MGFDKQMAQREEKCGNYQARSPGDADKFPLGLPDLVQPRLQVAPEEDLFGQRGKKDVADYELAVRIVLGKEVEIPDHIKFGDVAPLDTNGRPTLGSLDGELTAADALIILRRANQFILW